MRSSSLWLPIAVLTGTCLLAACAGSGPVPEPSPLPEIKKQTLKSKRVWRQGLGDGGERYVTGFVPAVDGQYAYTAHRDGRIAAVGLEDGDVVWTRDTELALSAGPAVAKGRLLVGTRDGLLLALSADDGSELWRRDMSSEILSAPAALNDSVVVRTLDGRLAAFGLADGNRRWTVEHSVPTLTSRGTSSPVIMGDTVYAGLDNGKLVALDLSNGEQRWEQMVAAPTGRSELERIVDIDAELLVAGNEVYVASTGGKIASLSRISGRVRWQRDIPSRTGLTFRGNSVFVTDVDGGVWSLGRNSGAALWEQEALAHRGLTAPAVHRGYIVVGDSQGYLHWMIPEDGTIVARAHPVGDAIATAPMVIGKRILVLSETGQLAMIETSFVDAGE